VLHQCETRAKCIGAARGKGSFITIGVKAGKIAFDHELSARNTAFQAKNTQAQRIIPTPGELL
jgi:hypothetical protein